MILRILLFCMAIVLLIGWVLGYFHWKHEGYTIHIMLILAVISLILALTRKKEID